ncbi:alkylhydroperoxidase domain protein [Corynebacterium timonense]|uniref:CMD domain protein, Avi_7170 family/alkylhydroperoxidase domain protein, Avi_7169 family n=1 Tax=Corynebacterium timonense TaxID=441500 RepID=A0A1H1SE52_9CORY|nr:alkylhydroperoxidase domain protein [Corynebacterium timonense]SDS46380.1 CMD domain protein, Avi_7170 family/alkylhydroperoxidase domain protein, Avi_7169 family [Corynebacterium timonense]
MSESNPNVIDLLSGAPADVAAVRGKRPDARDNAEASFRALLEPDEPGGLSQAWRYAVATFVAGVTGNATARDFYRELLVEEVEDGPEGEALARGVDTAIARGVSTGPYSGGGFVTFGPESGLSGPLAAAFDVAHLFTFHPKDASPAAIGHLQEAGWSDDAIVSLAQLIAFLAFQLRVVHGMAVLAGRPAPAGEAERADGVGTPGWEPGPRTLRPDVVAPEGFVAHSLGWKPWLADLPKEEFTQRHLDALIKPERIGSEYFRLLARDPEALKARTLTDLDIFYNTDGGLGRAERELAATVVSRLNGCEYCASVHQARAKEEGGDAEAIDRLLQEGVGADLGSPLWDAIREAALALTTTPVGFAPRHVEQLRAQGLDEVSIVDVINSASFFNWANRLMLGLGQPDVPKRFR